MEIRCSVESSQPTNNRSITLKREVVLGPFTLEGSYTSIGYSNPWKYKILLRLLKIKICLVAIVSPAAVPMEKDPGYPIILKLINHLLLQQSSVIL